jgi:hypothetical protein
MDLIRYPINCWNTPMLRHVPAGRLAHIPVSWHNDRSGDNTL